MEARLHRTNRIYDLAILDNDAFALEALGTLLEREVDFHVSWTSTSPMETIVRCLDHDNVPDILLLDMSLGENESGCRVCRHIRKATKDVPILAMTSFTLKYYMKDASLSGVQGIVSKSDRDGVVRAIRTVLMGGTWGSMFDTTAISHIRLQRHPPQRLLTEREASIMNIAATGLPLRGIAKRLGISESTVKTLISRIKPKLGATSLREAIAIWTGERDA